MQSLAVKILTILEAFGKHYYEYKEPINKCVLLQTTCMYMVLLIRFFIWK